VCCSVLQCVAACCSVSIYRANLNTVSCNVSQCVAVRGSAWQCVAVCCIVLQCIPVCCSVSVTPGLLDDRCVLQSYYSVLQRVAACCSVLQQVAACCSVFQRFVQCFNIPCQSQQCRACWTTNMDVGLFCVYAYLLCVYGSFARM